MRLLQDFKYNTLLSLTMRQQHLFALIKNTKYNDDVVSIQVLLKTHITLASIWKPLSENADN